jgi:beta-1,4-mannosyltransferase
LTESLRNPDSSIYCLPAAQNVKQKRREKMMSEPQLRLRMTVSPRAAEFGERSTAEAVPLPRSEVRATVTSGAERVIAEVVSRPRVDILPNTAEGAGRVISEVPSRRRLAVLPDVVDTADTADTVDAGADRPMGFLPSGRVTTVEPRRDSGLGFATGHRTFVLFCVVATSLALFFFQRWAWPSGSQPATWYGRIWSLGSLLWLAPLLPAVLGLIGLLWYRHPDDLDDVTPIRQLVVFRIVTRGTNAEALSSTITRCRREMAATPLFRYLIEVVTDSAGPWTLGTNDIVQIVVPSNYTTKARSLFKARALQYAVENSTIPHDAWIVHLDEETHLTPSGVKGIAKMIGEEEDAGTLRIGQGAILYHRNWKKHPFLTMADNVRTGDDFGRFHFQHRTGRTLFGLHGSFIVCRNDIAREIGFDFGPNGSITEDAFWALVAMENGHRARWVEGYLEEQSTQSVGDFMRQRRRWFQGLWKVSIHAPVNMRYRLALLINTVLWSTAPLSFLYTIVHFFIGYKVSMPVQIMADVTWAAFATLYLVGMKANLDEHGIHNPIKRLGWYVLQLIFMPVFALLEAAGVLLAIGRPHAGFHVVKK